MTCKRGDVVLVLFSHSSLRSAKKRPALVIQATSLTTGLPQTVVAMITGKMIRAGHLSRVALPLGSAISRGTGLRTDSVVTTDNIATILDSAIDRTIGAIGDMTMIDAALRHTLSL